jgi:cysteinyl-tRNA synthetase
VVELAERRVAARVGRDFDEADRLREQIEAAGWEVRDRSTRRYILVRKR